ncbi:MAG: sigma-70 family RNA polymerase sigma factor [Verrucomicrobia bacterium]|nr:sigma-70 family RNA polymerase sigma factor [Verrucomicrobiota bacterium]
MPPAPSAGRSPRFATTQWSMIVAARCGPASEADAALESFCRAYWYPLYAYVRRSGHAQADAQDLTQAFFARLLEKDWLSEALPERGRFRSFLLMALKRFLAKEWRRGAARKRGGGANFVPLDAADAEARYAVEPSLGPDAIFERRWAMTILDRALGRLADEYAAADRTVEFELLKPHLTAARGEIPYEETGAALGLNPGAARVAVHRLRKRFRETLRQEIAETVADAADLEDELRHLVQILGQRA